MSRYREKKIRSLKELRRALEGLELDQGVRIICRLGDDSKEGFLFLTKPSERYCINICSRLYDENLKSYVPGGEEEWIYCESVDEVWKRVKAYVQSPLQAWIY